MVKDDILAYPEPILLRKAREVTEEEFKKGEIEGESLTSLSERMLMLCRNAKGAGLAAPQVGVGVRMFVAFKRDLEPLVAFNPEVLNPEGEEESIEGCLSLPGILLSVKRARKVLLKYKDSSGNPQETEAEGLFAREAQHESDHLDGVLITKRANLIANVGARKIVKGLEDAYAKRMVPKKARKA